MNTRPFIFLALVFTLVPALAQQPGGIITGIVRDTSGRALPGVTVEATGPNLGAAPRQVVTDAQGRYTLTDLPAAFHGVVFRLPGFGSLTRNLLVDASSPASVDVVMAVRPLAETYRVPPRQGSPDPRPFCLHGVKETPQEQQRRMEALAAMRLIYGLLSRVPASPLGYPDWQTLARSKVVADLKNIQGETGELARKIQWGSNEPLPGWTFSYKVGVASVAFAIRDLRDLCEFTYSSTDPDVVAGSSRIIPLAPDVAY
jgi:hypothetical protein